MKIAIIIWDLSCIGGIATQAFDIQKILNKFKIENEIIILTSYIKKSNDIKENKIITTEKLFKVQGIRLSVHKNHINKTLNYLNKFDTFLHTTACIHDDTLDWLKIYKANKKQIVIISDVYWNKFYPYYDKAIKYIDKFLATNSGVQTYLQTEKNITTELLIQPFFFDKVLNEKKVTNSILWTNQWRGWKGINVFAENSHNLNCEVLLFGNGREYYNLKNNIPNNAKFFGFVSPELIIKYYKSSKMSIDLTGRSKKYYGHYNRTTIEPMFYGCISVVNDKLLKPYSHIPHEVVLPVTTKNFVYKINELIKNEKKQKEIITKAFEWSTNFYDNKKFIEQILSNVKKDIQINSSLQIKLL